MAALVAHSLREDLRREYIVGGQLPSEPDLAEKFGVSRGTVRQALAVLEREGVIIRRQGSGTYVHYISRAQTRAEHAYEFTDLLRSAGFEPGIRMDSNSYEPLSDKDAARLNLKPGSMALVVRKTFFAGEEPAIYCIDSIPKKLIISEFDEEELKKPIFNFMRERCRQETVQNLAELIPTLPTEELASLLEMDPAVPLLRIDEVGYNAEGEPVVLHSAYYRDQFIRFSLLRKRIW